MSKPSKKSNQILRVAIAVPLHKIFDYFAPNYVNATQIGIRVCVPFGKQKKIGILIGITQYSDLLPENIKQVLEFIDDRPVLSSTDIKMLRWISSYYHHPLGLVLVGAMPALLRKGKRAKIQQPKLYQLSAQGLKLNPATLVGRVQQRLITHLQSYGLATTKQLSKLEKNWRSAMQILQAKGWVVYATQQHLQPPHRLEPVRANAQQQKAIDGVRGSMDNFATFLLEGVTGSGKTEVYMQLIGHVIAQGKQVLVLLPEIGLTPQLERRFKQCFSVAVEVFHSGLTDLQRCNIWLKSQQGHSQIIVGTRSALMMPMPKLGLIIIDEEHDSSFKQQEGLRFSARDVAIVRAKKLNIPIVLGTATPSLESFYNIQTGRYRHLYLPNRAGLASTPTLTLLDIRNKLLHGGVADILLTAISAVLAKGEQALLFLNRRGFAPALMCHGCGWVAQCQRCDANLVIHHQDNVLRCHHCCHHQPLPKQCFVCQKTALLALGLGTERVEQVLQQHFPKQTIIRLDRDSTRGKGTLEKSLQQINKNDAAIILGTQMLAKGHHFPNVTLVGILDVDGGLFSVDFHATEKMAQMIIQVAGRAGRAEKPGRVILQTRHPEHQLLLTLVSQGYRQFASNALQERQQASLPPFSHQALFRGLSMNKLSAIYFLEKIATLAFNKAGKDIAVMGPISAPMARRVGRFRYQLLLQAPNRASLHVLLDYLVISIANIKGRSKVRWSLDVDPVDLY